MILVVDSSALALIINPDADPPDDPATCSPLTRVPERIRFLLSNLSTGDTIVVPTPVLAEILVKAGDGAPEVLFSLQGLARIRIVPFDERAAIETAMMTRDALASGDKRGGSDQAWQKVKFDRQIVAIARAHGATRIFADDHRLASFAAKLGMDVFSSWNLPLPEVAEDLFTIAGIAPDGESNYES